MEMDIIVNSRVPIAATTRDKINLKWDSVLEEHMIETCTVLVDDMAYNLGHIS